MCAGHILEAAHRKRENAIRGNEVEECGHGCCVYYHDPGYGGLDLEVLVLLDLV